MKKMEELFDIEKFKDKKYKFVKILMNNGIYIFFYPRRIVSIERFKNDVNNSIVKIETMEQEYMFCLDDISSIHYEKDVEESVENRYILTQAQEFIINEIKEKKNRSVRIWFDEKYIVILPLDVILVKFVLMSDDFAIIIETKYYSHVFPINSISRMEIEKFGD